MKQLDLKTLEKYYEDGWLIKQTHPKLPLTIWNYSIATQYEQHWDDVTLQCRGLVTDNMGNIIARPFKKFFNMEEAKHKATSNFEVFEKMDGSLIIVFKYLGQIVVASRGSFTSDHAVLASKLVNKLDNNYILCDLTYLFELVGPTFRIVVDYPDDKLILLNINETLIEREVAYDLTKLTASKLGVDVVKRYDGISDFKLLKKMVDNNAEGFVVKFSNGDRMKVKGEEYVRLHKIMTEISTTNVWRVLSEGRQMDSILDNVPDEYYDKIKAYEHTLMNEFLTLKARIVTEGAAVSLLLGDVDQKAFALYIKDHKWKHYFFSLRNGQSIDEGVWRDIRPEFKKL